MSVQRRIHSRGNSDYFVTVAVFVLVVFGLVMLTSASSHLGKTKHGDAYYYLKHQITVGVLPGLILFFVASRLHYRRYEKWAMPILLGSFGLLLLIFTPFAVKAGGATRWVAFGPLSFQPSEIVKLGFIVYLAAWLGRPKERERSFTKGFLPFLVVCGALTGVLLKERSTSVAVMLIATALVVYFVSGAKLFYIVGSVLAAGAVLALIIFVTPYRRERVLNFLDPEANLRGGGYHLNQALIAIGSGGIWGVGYGESTTKIFYLPEPVGDSIFAVIAEELGFVGSFFVLFLFLALVARMFILSARARDKFGQLLLVGFASLLAIQTLINIGAISGLLPMTGVPLPFISYGGTALSVYLAMAGIVINVSKYTSILK